MRGLLVVCKFSSVLKYCQKSEIGFICLEALMKEALCDEKHTVWLWPVEQRLFFLRERRISAVLVVFIYKCDCFTVTLCSLPCGEAHHCGTKFQYIIKRYL